jgi:hypothetical protein
LLCFYNFFIGTEQPLVFDPPASGLPVAAIACMAKAQGYLSKANELQVCAMLKICARPQKMEIFFHHSVMRENFFRQNTANARIPAGSVAQFDT